MKVRRCVVKAVRACDDWDDEDYSPWYETGSSYELNDEGSWFRSVSTAAHRAMSVRPATTIGFHKPTKG